MSDIKDLFFSQNGAIFHLWVVFLNTGCPTPQRKGKSAEVNGIGWPQWIAGEDGSAITFLKGRFSGQLKTQLSCVSHPRCQWSIRFLRVAHHCFLPWSRQKDQTGYVYFLILFNNWVTKLSCAANCSLQALPHTGQCNSPVDYSVLFSVWRKMPPS